ncbi:Odorant receptor 430 [Nylanderia fulva]|uniref:Odorant receptor 430 n=1 Tax=Nylanderia fulva TaxID=613905 RepID=A0A6G1LPR1_9HYME|nr:Odorant receptor 430 [Nylanderia fulva]
MFSSSSIWLCLLILVEVCDLLFTEDIDIFINSLSSLVFDIRCRVKLIICILKAREIRALFDQIQIVLLMSQCLFQTLSLLKLIVKIVSLFRYKLWTPERRHRRHVGYRLQQEKRAKFKYDICDF